MIFSCSILTSCSTKYKIWVGPDNAQKIFNLRYGAEKKQRMDIFLPAKYDHESPVVMIVHGGAWKFGNKEHMMMLQDHLHKQNIPTVNINYRLVSGRKNIRYTDQLKDIGAAVNTFNELARRAQLNANNFVLLGESAGAHLALLYGYKNPDQIKKIISLSGPTDFFTPKFLKTTYSVYASPTFQDVVGEKFDRKKLSSKFIEASPVANVSNVPTLLFQGDSDFMVNKRQGLMLDSVLTAKNVPHQFIYMKNTGHVPRLFNKYKRDSIILPAIVNFIKN